MGHWFLSNIASFLDQSSCTPINGRPIRGLHCCAGGFSSRADRQHGRRNGGCGRWERAEEGQRGPRAVVQELGELLRAALGGEVPADETERDRGERGDGEPPGGVRSGGKRPKHHHSRSSWNWENHQHPVFGPSAAGSFHERRRAGAERLQRQGHRRGQEQDQDVRSAEGHAAQGPTQGHHPGRSRQHDGWSPAGAEKDHGDLLQDDALRPRLQRLGQDHRAHPVPLRRAALLQAGGRADPVPAAGGGGEGTAVRVRRRSGGRHLHRPGRHETGAKQPAVHQLRLRLHQQRERVQSLRRAAPSAGEKHAGTLRGREHRRGVPGGGAAVGAGILSRGHHGQHLQGLQDLPDGRVPEAGVHQGDRIHSHAGG